MTSLGRPSAPLGLLLIAAAAAAPGTGASLLRHEASRVSMGCAYAIAAYGADATALARSAEAALDEVDRIDRLMSHYKPESPLSRLNREAARGPVAVDPELFDFLAEAERYGRESNGAFDVTVGPVMKAWGFFRGEGRVPDEKELRELRRRVGFRHVILDPRRRTIRFDRPGVELDLGGIAKGYAVDRAVDVLRNRGVAAALVSAGGSTLYGLGAPPERDAWEVSLQDPLDAGRVALTVPLRDRALSVAGSTEKSFEMGGVSYSHIMDPRTCRPVRGVLTVAVLAASGTEGDALDDALFVEGLDGARAHVESLADTEALFFLPRDGVRWEMIRLGP